MTPVPSSVAVLADVRQVPFILAVVIGSLWLLVGTHAMLLAVRRRRGELAVLRALGMRAAEVRRAVVWQAVAMGVVTICIGIPAGLLLGRVAWTAIARPANVLVHVDIAPLVLASMAVAAIASLVAAAVWPGIRAARLRVSDVLRSD
jgi:ABC-type antimicrobial peptide transport system permease subunit